jgi:hypothetical protein
MRFVVHIPTFQWCGRSAKRPALIFGFKVAIQKNAIGLPTVGEEARLLFHRNARVVDEPIAARA